MKSVSKKAGAVHLKGEGLVPISKQMRVSTAVRLGLVVAVSCWVLVGCGGVSRDRPVMFPLPELGATRAGRVVTVSYRLPESGQPRPKWILVKVTKQGRIPVGGNYRVRGNSGKVKIKIPFEGDRLVALAQTLDLEGHSELAKTPVR